MWDCGCGCRLIAGSVATCPMCGKEKDMPTITSGGPSNDWEPQDAAATEVDQVPTQVGDGADTPAEPAVEAVGEQPEPATAPDAPAQDATAVEAATDPAPAVTFETRRASGKQATATPDAGGDGGPA